RGGDQHDVASFRYWRLVNDTARAISDFPPRTMLSASAYSSRRGGACSSGAPIATAGMPMATALLASVDPTSAGTIAGVPGARKGFLTAHGVCTRGHFDLR